MKLFFSVKLSKASFIHGSKRTEVWSLPIFTIIDFFCEKSRFILDNVRYFGAQYKS